MVRERTREGMTGTIADRTEDKIGKERGPEKVAQKS